MAVDIVYRQNLRQQELDFVLYAIFRVDEGRQLFGKVDCFIDRHLYGFIFVFFEQESKSRNHSLARMPKFVAERKSGFIVLRKSGQKAMQCFNSACLEHFIKNLNFVDETFSNLFEAKRKLSHVYQGNFQILAEITELLVVAFQTLNHRLDDVWASVMVSVDDLVLSFKVDRAAHEDERSVESVFVGAVGFVDEEGVAALDDFLVDAFLLAFVVDAHVAKHAEREFCNFLPLVVEGLLDFCVVQDLGEVLYCLFAKQSLDPVVAKSEIDEGLEQQDEVLSFFIIHALAV